jgi:ABC-2 type transport system ATP-binding protein
MSVAADAIRIDGLTKRYGDRLAVDRLTFSVPGESVTGFLGPNGAGKTTTMRVLLGLAAATSGEANVLGGPYRSLDTPLRRVGAALEITGFHPGRTARNHLRIVCLQGGLPQDRADAVLALTGMRDYADVTVKAFSFGMRQRLALATALLGEPEVLVLDEPANGLDPAGVAWLRTFLRRFADGGGAVLISSHILSEIAEVADRVVVIDRGALVTQGSVAELTAAAGESVVVRSPDLDRLRPALEAVGASIAVEPDGSVAVRNLAIEEVGRIAAEGGAILHELRRRTSTLEDAFLALTGDGATPPATGLTGDGATPPARPDAAEQPP